MLLLATAVAVAADNRDDDVWDLKETREVAGQIWHLRGQQELRGRRKVVLNPQP